MTTTCPDCLHTYDDQYRLTLCPHQTFPANDGNNNFRHHPNSPLLLPQEFYDEQFETVSPLTGYPPNGDSRKTYLTLLTEPEINAIAALTGWFSASAPPKAVEHYRLPLESLEKKLLPLDDNNAPYEDSKYPLDTTGLAVLRRSQTHSTDFPFNAVLWCILASVVTLMLATGYCGGR